MTWTAHKEIITKLIIANEERKGQSGREAGQGGRVSYEVYSAFLFMVETNTHIVTQSFKKNGTRLKLNFPESTHNEQSLSTGEVK